MNSPYPVLVRVLCVFLLLSGTLAAQETFKPGAAIEYRDGSNWVRGTVIRPLEGGKQYLIRQKPSQFFPEGFERAYRPDELRRPMADAPKGPGNPAKPLAGLKPDAPIPVVPRDDRKPRAALTEEQVLSYARTLFGSSNREANEMHPRRSDLLDQIRDHIKKNGADFKAPADGDFYKRLAAQGTHSVHIIFAINDNYGPHPALEDHFGTFLLRGANRGSSSVKTDSAGVKKIVVEDSQHESGRLTIRRDGTYEWELLRGDPASKWLRGQWRAAKPDEMMPTEGGPALWLEKAKGGYDYMVRMDREVGYSGWIDVGAGKGRTPVEYGRPSATK